jgi:hypothetical protein
MSAYNLCKRCHHFKDFKQCWKFRNAKTKTFLLATACRDDPRLCGPDATRFRPPDQPKMYPLVFLGAMGAGSFAFRAALELLTGNLLCVVNAAVSVCIFNIVATHHYELIKDEHITECIDVDE